MWQMEDREVARRMVIFLRGEQIWLPGAGVTVRKTCLVG